MSNYQRIPNPGGNGSYSPLTALETRKLERTATTITPGGSWCWFNGPTIVDSGNVRFMGWIQSDGGVIVSSLDLTTGAVAQFNLHAAFATGGPSNDHASPAIVVRKSDQRIIVFYAQQGSSPIYYRVSTNPLDISAFGTEQTLTTETSATYPHPHYIGNRLYVFYTSDPTGRVMYSDDHGVTWTGPLLWLSSSPNPGMYWQIRSNGSRLDFIISMHPNSSGASYAALSNMWHGYFDGTNFCATDGTVVTSFASLPTIANPNVYTQTGGVTVTSLSKVYDVATNGLCWAWDVGLDSAGHPVAVFSSYAGSAVGDTYGTVPSHFTDHRYNYYRWNGTAWVGAQIVAAGGKLGDNYGGFQEYQYSGGIALVQSDPTVVYLSRQVAPSLQFEVERWVTTDGYGTAWASTPMTVESSLLTKQFRPMTPANPAAGAPDVAWLSGSYFDYTVFNAAVVVAGPAPLAQTAAALLKRPAGAGQTDVLIAPAKAVAPSMLLALAADITDSSGNAYQLTPAVTPVFGTGRYGDRQALTFDGATQYLTTKTYQPFQTGVTRTFFGWAKRTNHSAAHALFAGTVAAASHYPLLRLQSGSQDVFFTADTASGGVTWTGAWPGDNVWAHWALIFDDAADTVELYINGVSKGVLAHTVAFTNTNYLVIGRRPGDSYFNGAMALVGAYEGRLTASQIGQLAGSVTGSRNVNPALATLLPQLTAAGVIGVDNTTAGLPPSRVDILRDARNVVAETVDIMAMGQGASQLSALASGEITVGIIGCFAGDVIKGVAFNYSPTTPTLTLFKSVLYDTAGNLLAVSADVSGTIGTAAKKEVAFTAPYTILTTGAYYVGVIMTLTAGTVQLGRGQTSSLLSNAIDSGKTPIAKMTGQTDATNPATFVGGNNAQASFWFAAYK